MGNIRLTCGRRETHSELDKHPSTRTSEHGRFRVRFLASPPLSTSSEPPSWAIFCHIDVSVSVIESTHTSGNGSYGLAITIGGVPIGAVERVFFRGTTAPRGQNVSWNTRSAGALPTPGTRNVILQSQYVTGAGGTMTLSGLSACRVTITCGGIGALLA